MRWQSLPMMANWTMRGIIFLIRWFRDLSRFSDVVYIGRGRSSDRGSGSQRARHRELRMMEMLSRSSILPVRVGPSLVM